MAIIGSTMTKDATIVVTPGAETATWETDGVLIPNGLHLIDVNAPFSERTQFTLKSRVPVLDIKSGKYTKPKKSFSIARPVVGTDGTVEFATLRVELDYPATIDFPADLVTLSVQVLTNDALSKFRANGSLS